jgi:hypothetical protein
MNIIEGNPVIRHKFAADPTALVYNDLVYLYTGHDEAAAGDNRYIMNEWLCFSSSDLLSWNEHPVPLKPTDFSWASGDAYASKVVFVQGRFYWFVAVSNAADKKKAIGLAVSETPAGPFRDAIGAPLITHDMLPKAAGDKANLDPSVLIDDDGKTYIFWGNGICYYASLKEDLSSLQSDIQILELPGFAEGAHIHKKNGWYYLSYGYGSPEKVAYAMSRSIGGPWQFKGILNELAGNCETNRPCILEFRNIDYFIYHNGGVAGGGSHRRSVCIDKLYYNADGSMKRVVMTTEGLRG